MQQRGQLLLLFSKKYKHVCTTSDVTRSFHSCPVHGTIKVKYSDFAASKHDFKKSQSKNKLVNDIQHSVNYEMSTTARDVFSHFINTLKSGLSDILYTFLRQKRYIIKPVTATG